MRIWLLALGLLAMQSAVCSDGASKSLRALDRRERAYWSEFDNRFREAATAWYEPVRVQRHSGDNEPVRDLAKLRALFRELVDIEESRVAMYAEVGATKNGHLPLIDAFVGTLEEIAKTEVELSSVKRRAWRLLLDQRPAFRREALETRLRGLRTALRMAGGAPHLVKLLPKLAKRDGRHFPWRQIGVLDALRGAEWGVVVLLVTELKRGDPVIRIATLEILARAGLQGQVACLPLLGDPDPGVRRALLESIPTEHRKTWLKPVTRAYLKASGRFRCDCVATLERLTGRSLGDVPDAWKELLEDRPLPEATTSEPTPAPSFYGIRLSSERLMFLLEGSFTFTVPASYALQRTRHFMEWGNWGKADWKREHASHQQILTSQLEKTLAALPERAAFRVTMMGHPGNVFGRLSSLDGRRGRLLSASPRNTRKAKRFVEEHKVAFVHDIDVGLTKALEGVDHDTVIVFGNGEITGGRFCLPELLLASFRRRNRFRRLVVHCVRVCNMGPDAEWLLKELASSSGGTYVWNKAPPS